MAIPYLPDPRERPGAQLFASPSAYTGGVLNAVTPLPAPRPDPLVPNSMAAPGGIIQVPEQKPGILGRIGNVLANPAVSNRLSALGAELLANSGYQQVPLTTGAGLGRGLQAMNQAGMAYDQMLGQQAAAALDKRMKEAQLRKTQAEAVKTSREAMGGGSLFQGTGMEAQAWNILTDPNLDPQSEQAQIAYSIVTQPRQSYDAASGQMLSYTPQIPASVAARFGAPKQDGAAEPAGIIPPVAKATKVAPGTMEATERARIESENREKARQVEKAQADAEKDYRKKYAAAVTGVKTINEMAGMLNKRSPTGAIFKGYDQARLEGLQSDLLQVVRFANELGALQQSDIALIEGNVPQISKAFSIDNFDPSTAQGKLKATYDLINRRLEEYAIANNVDPGKYKLPPLNIGGGGGGGRLSRVKEATK